MITMLDELTFHTVVKSTPLISIDLIVRDQNGSVLLGQRLNRPAQGYWFVPGGRVLKDERLADAFRRLTEVELGVGFEISDARYLGLYEHFYDDSALDAEVSTHYVVNAFELTLTAELVSLPKEQHSGYQWFNQSELLASNSVHDHSKWYFMNEKGYSV